MVKVKEEPITEPVPCHYACGNVLGLPLTAGISCPLQFEWHCIECHEKHPPVLYDGPHWLEAQGLKKLPDYVKPRELWEPHPFTCIDCGKAVDWNVDDRLYKCETSDEIHCVACHTAHQTV